MSNPQKEHFEQAYLTGSDLWSLIDYMPPAFKLLGTQSADALILDVGSGRGKWAFRLAEAGYRVIGMDYVSKVVKQANLEVKNRNLGNQVRFVEGDVLAIPFTDSGFDVVTDIGVLQHLPESSWSQYIGEISRVLKQGGVYLNVSLSRETANFMDFKPAKADTGRYNKFGLSYYFFTKDEIHALFGAQFDMVEQESHIIPYSETDSVTLVFSKMVKR